jgi:hypothetical protein
MEMGVKQKTNPLYYISIVLLLLCLSFLDMMNVLDLVFEISYQEPLTLQFQHDQVNSFSHSFFKYRSLADIMASEKSEQMGPRFNNRLVFANGITR